MPLHVTNIDMLNRVGFKAWMNNYIHVKQWDVIIRPRPNSNVGD